MRPKMENGNTKRYSDSTLLPLMTSIDEKSSVLQCKTIIGNSHEKMETSESPSPPVPTRETWGKNFEFLLSVIGFAVDLSSVYRFPYVCYSNGGGAFLIPYFVMFVFGGLPLFYLELSLGQYQRVGCISVWRRICPIFKGVGFGICMIAFYVSIYYNTIMSWALYFLFESMRMEVPWKTCNNTWNTENCTEFHIYATNLSQSNSSGTTSGAQEFFNLKVLEIQLSDKMSHLGNIKWSIALCLLFIFIIVYFSLWKGIKSSGKAVWVTAIFPYIVLIILLVRGVTLEGAEEGIIYYLKPNWDKLVELKVWRDAAAQVFFSLGPGFGVLMALSSYNKFHNNCYRDALITSFINFLTSFLAGFVVFAGLGYMSHQMKRPIDKVAQQGPGLVFEVYPEVIAQLPGSPFFAVMFFLLLITLGLDSTFGGLEALITGVLDEWPALKPRREFFVAALISCCFLTSLSTTTYGGKYLVTLLDRFAAPISILLIVFLETVAVSWFYGFLRFSRDIKAMLGYEPGFFWKACWAVITPTILLALFTLSVYDLATSPLSEGDYTYPSWCIALGWLIVCSSLICVPIGAVYKLCRSQGPVLERLKASIIPEEEPINPDHVTTGQSV